MPLIVMLHDDYTTPFSFLAGSGFSQIAEEHGVIVIAPQGTLSSLSDNPWDTPEERRDVSVIIEEMIAEMCIDESQIFGVGHGAGAYLVQQVHCDHLFAAIAMSATRTNWARGSCTERVPTIWFDGKDSDAIPFAGGIGCGQHPKDSHQDALGAFHRGYGCRGEARNLTARTDGQCVTWSCERDFEACTLAGGARWPQVPMSLTDCNDDAPTFPMAAEAWSFFQRVTKKRK